MFAQSGDNYFETPLKKTGSINPVDKLSCVIKQILNFIEIATQCSVIQKQCTSWEPIYYLTSSKLLSWQFLHSSEDLTLDNRKQILHDMLLCSLQVPGHCA